MKYNPIVVRPRKGSDLEAIWIANDRNAGRMRELFHAWAFAFANTPKMTTKGKTDDAL